MPTLTDARWSREQARDWVDEFRPALRLALEEFLSLERWPAREEFRRRLVQRKLDYLSFDELVRDMPVSPWEHRKLAPERIVLSFRVLREMAEAQPLLDVCVAITQKAYDLYRSEHEAELVIRSDDPDLLAVAGEDVRLLSCARELLDQHPPSPLGGLRPGTRPTEWGRSVNDETIHAFKGVMSIDDYLAAQERIIGNDQGLVTPSDPSPEISAYTPVPARLFVIMPFSEPWSDSTYAFIRRTIARLDSANGGLYLYRADDIAEPGQITQQIRDSIATAHVTIADITGVNPNVMWELGYADGLGRTIVILNQHPGTSPFDMMDRRQVAYSAAPTADDEENLLRHIVEALRIGRPRPASDRS